MIEHLHDREKALEPLGWTGREAEWIALVCLHSGVFTRAHFCFYFEGARRNRASLFVRDLVDRRLAVEYALPNKRGRAKACRISNKEIYRKLGIENVRHRRDADDSAMLRRLLSLDYVLEHPELPWLPTEPEKVEFFEKLGLSRRLIPRRIYYGAVGAQKRYFALKLPIAGDAATVTFVYVDPGHQTDSELHSWGAAHRALWDALRKKGRQVRVIGIAAEHETVERTERVLRAWSAVVPGEPSEGLTAAAEIKAIGAAKDHRDREFLAQYGGFAEAAKRSVELQKLPESRVTEGVSIDDYSTWRATRFAGPKDGFGGRVEDS